MKNLYKYILFPGRHHTITNFQIDYLKKIISNKQAIDLDGNKTEFSDDMNIIWAITSGNYANTRRNPIPGTRRMSMVELITNNLLSAESKNYLIPNMAPKSDFAHYVIEEIRVQSKGQCEMNPQNTVVACSTPEVIEQYQSIGYRVLPVELIDYRSQQTESARPWDLVQEIIDTGLDWENSELIKDLMPPLEIQYFKKYNLQKHIQDIFSDPLTDDEGDITDTREYEVYRAAFEDNAHRKVNEFAKYVQPGKIVDVGCATGQTIKLLSEKSELFESDFYGIEAARPLYDICEQRRHNGVFGNTNVFFYQRNIMHSEIFPSDSVNSLITMALTHEIESYMGRQSLNDFLKRMFQMLVPGGVYINYDVVGPKNKDDIVLAKLNEDDGLNPTDLYPKNKEYNAEFLDSLSSKARFLRFCNDFREKEGDKISANIITIDGVSYFELKYGDLCEFLAKKDYTDSWQSEMHERFCFWSYEDWNKALEDVGFSLHYGSKPIRNPWLIKNRFKSAAKVYKTDTIGSLQELEQPHTNVMLIAQKPL